MEEDKSLFQEIVEQVDRWAQIISKTAKNILETEPTKKEQKPE
jgi:hypothetical protein